MLAVVGIWTLVVANPVQGQHVADDGLSAFLYVANWHFIASSQPYLAMFVNKTPSPLLHTWSLAIEEQFYLFWPLIVLGVGAFLTRGARDRRDSQRFRRVLVGVCLALAAGSLLRMITLYNPGRDPSRVYYGTDSRAFVLLIGAALGALTAGVPMLRRRYVRVVAVTAGIAAAVALGLAMRFADAHQFVAVPRRLRPARRHHGRGPRGRHPARLEPVASPARDPTAGRLGPHLLRRLSLALAGGGLADVRRARARPA